MYDLFFVRVFLICTTVTEKSVTTQASEFVKWASLGLNRDSVALVQKIPYVEISILLYATGMSKFHVTPIF